MVFHLGNLFWMDHAGLFCPYTVLNANPASRSRAIQSCIKKRHYIIEVDMYFFSLSLHKISLFLVKEMLFF